MQTALQTPVKRRKRTRMRYSNRFKVLICYLFCFALPPLWLLACLAFVYPYQLKNSAPQVLDNLTRMLPFLKSPLANYVEAAAAPDGAQLSAEVWNGVQQAREHQWMLFLLVLFAAAWLLTLLIQLIWRFCHTKALQSAKAVGRAVVHYRISMLVIFLLNALAAALVWLLGVQFISGRGLWDYVTYFVPYFLNCLAALCCFRLAAPPAISGKKAFFKRL